MSSFAEVIKTIKDNGTDRAGYWYLASPYSKYPYGIHWAAAEISRVSGMLMANGIVNVCPIAGSHSITLYADYDGDFEGWEQLDKALISADTCHGIIVTMMSTWEESHGIREEIKHAESLGKPVIYLEYDEVA